MATQRENYREDVAGRANVEDTPELLAYYSELERLDTGALWTVANKIEPWFPKSASVPILWRYRDLRPHVLHDIQKRLVRGDGGGGEEFDDRHDFIPDQDRTGDDPGRARPFAARRATLHGTDPGPAGARWIHPADSPSHQ